MTPSERRQALPADLFDPWPADNSPDADLFGAEPLETPSKRPGSRTDARSTVLQRVPAERRGVPPVPAPQDWTGQEPPLRVPEWEPLGYSVLAPAEAGRHILVLGESGSGKSRSAVMPFVRAVLRYPEAAALLVVDPKRELGPYVDECVRSGEATDRRVIHIDPRSQDGPRAWMWEGREPLDLSAEEIVEGALGLSERARRERSSRHQPFFIQSAEKLLRSLIDVDLWLYRVGGTEALDAFWRDIADQSAPISDGVDLRLNRENYLRTHSDFLRVASGSLPGAHRVYASVCELHRVPATIRTAATELIRIPSQTAASIIATLLNVLGEVTDDVFGRGMSLFPFAPPDEEWLSLLEVMRRGWAVVVIPDPAFPTARALGRAIKAKFFELSFIREDQHRPVAYVADEFQRVATGDPITGEQSYLDRCRAYRVWCCLATQSVASMRYALAQHEDERTGGAALDILLTNTGTKFFFRSSDIGTQDRLERLIPPPSLPGKPHVARARPITTLTPGECYLLRSAGTWGRGQARASRTGGR